MKTKKQVIIGLLLSSLTASVNAAPGSGTEGASFLNIPVGAEPAAMGGAYSASALNAYAPTWNPGGLGKISGTQIAVQHLDYLESINYEHFGFVQPFDKGRGFGASIQYLGTADISATDATGAPMGSFDSHYGAYSLSYGHSLSSRLSMGITGKLIEAKIESVSATAYAADFGALYQATTKLMLAGVLRNVGTELKFLNEGDPLPLGLHLGGTYLATPAVTLALEGVVRQTGLASVHSGIEWRPADPLALRIGYRTDTIKELSALAGLTAGVGIKVMGQTLSYAWVPLDDLGNTQYISLLIQFR